MLEKVITVPLKMTAQRQETLDTDTIVFSKDVNNVKLVIDVLDEQAEKIYLDYNYQPSIAVRLPESGFKGIYDDVYIEDGKIVWWFDTSIITTYETALLNVYLKNDFRQYDLGEFIVMVDVSDIDTVAGEAKSFYIKKIDDWLSKVDELQKNNDIKYYIDTQFEKLTNGLANEFANEFILIRNETEEKISSISSYFEKNFNLLTSEIYQLQNKPTLYIAVAEEIEVDSSNTITAKGFKQITNDNIYYHNYPYIGIGHLNSSIPENYNWFTNDSSSQFFVREKIIYGSSEQPGIYIPTFDKERET